MGNSQKIPLNQKVKVVATIGPACSEPYMLQSMIENGLDIARINTSHAGEKEVTDLVGLIRKISGKLCTNTAIMIDLQGPKIRIGKMEQDLMVKRGDILSFTPQPVKQVYDPDKGIMLEVSYSKLIEDIKKEGTLYIDDGLIECRILEIDKRQSLARCEVIRGGMIQSHKGINLPGVRLSLDSVTEKDLYFLDLGISLGVDFIAQSFVREAHDIEIVRKAIKKKKGTQMIVAKIEKHEAINNFSSILQQADAIMIARGDLGIEIDEEDVPILQKKIIKETNQAGKPVITATQMLDSMMRNPRPTRAEVSDVANAILDGSDAIMLSGETAIGKYPLESLQMMTKIINKTEQELETGSWLRQKGGSDQDTITEAISSASCEIADRVQASTIITSTQSGHTARQVAKNRPRSIIIGASPYDYVVRQLMVSWGVVPVKTSFAGNISEIINEAIQAGKKEGYLHKGDTVVITGGILVNKPGSTNFINVKKID